MIKSTLLQSRNSILCLSAVYDQINATAVPQYFVCACVCVCPLLLLLYLQLSARPRSCARAHTQPTPPTWFSDFCASIKSWNNVPESKTFRNLLCVVTVFALMIFKRHSRELPQISVYSSHGCKNVTFWNNRICKVKQTFLCFHWTSSTRVTEPRERAPVVEGARSRHFRLPLNNGSLSGATAAANGKKIGEIQ